MATGPGAGRELTLPHRLDTAAAPPLLAALRELRGQDLRLDAGSVEQLGGLCLQVLLTAAASWTEDGRVFEVSDPSGTMRSGLQQFGLQSLTQHHEGAAS